MFDGLWIITVFKITFFIFGLLALPTIIFLAVVFSILAFVDKIKNGAE